MVAAVLMVVGGMTWGVRVCGGKGGGMLYMAVWPLGLWHALYKSVYLRSVRWGVVGQEMGPQLYSGFSARVCDIRVHRSGSLWRVQQCGHHMLCLLSMKASRAQHVIATVLRSPDPPDTPWCLLHIVVYCVTLKM